MNAPTVSTADLTAIGACLLSSIRATVRLGHTTPAETLDYYHGLEESLDGEGSAAPVIVRDFIAWTGRRQREFPGAEDRLRAWIDACGWQSEGASP